MDEVSTVIVYSFRQYDPYLRMHDVAKFKAPRDLIVSRFKGEVLEGTHEEVEASALDADGRYRRIATGWGELA